MAKARVVQRERQHNGESDRVEMGGHKERARRAHSAKENGVQHSKRQWQAHKQAALNEFEATLPSVSVQGYHRRCA